MVVEAIETAPMMQPSPLFTVHVLDRLPAPVNVFGFFPLAVFRIAAAFVAMAGGALAYLYRDTLAGLVQHPAAIAPQGSTLYYMYANLNTIGYRLLDYVPIHAFRSPEWSPVTSILIAIGVAMAILHMVNGFESFEDDMEWDLEPVAD